MRRLLVLAVLVGSTLLVQSPAYAWHRFYSISIAGEDDSATLTVRTNCLPGQTLRLSSASLPGGGLERRIPRFSVRPGIQQLRIKTALVGGGSTATFRAWCNGHRLSAGEPGSDVAALAVPRPGDASELPWTGRSTLPWLTLGLGLVLAGGFLVALGRRERA